MSNEVQKQIKPEQMLCSWAVQMVQNRNASVMQRKLAQIIAQ